MLTKDYALANSHIGLSSIPTMAPKQNVNLGEVLAKGFENWDAAKTKEAEKKKTQDLIDALTEAHPEDAAQIASDPQAYAKMLQDNANAERDQQWKMDVLDKQFQNSLALQDRQHANAVGLAKLAAQLKGNDTTAQKNIAYLQSLGYSPEEAAQLYYSGQNPSLNVGMLGKKGQDTYDAQIAEDIVKKERLERSMPSFEQMAGELVDLADVATYTPAGQAKDAVRRFFNLPATEGAKAREKYKQTVANELLPKLKEVYGGQLSDSERENLLATLGDLNKSPEEKKEAVKSFLEAKYRQLDSYNRPVSTGAQTPNYKDKYGLE